MFDTLKEKSKTLSKVGSFYTSVITDKDIKVAHRLSHIPYCTSLFQNFNNMYKSLTNNAYTNKKYLRIEYKDADIKCGRYNSQNKNSDYLPIQEEIDILPQHLQQRLDKVILEENFSLAFVLTIPSDIYVRIIELPDGSILTDGLNFKSQFGSIVFTENPISLFKGMHFFALSYTKRNRNILCYPLQLQDIYGGVSYVVDYYRNNQSLKQFKKALYQAIGIPVVLQDDSIKDKVNLVNGVSYITSDGIHYDADFPHTQLNVGDILHKDDIIGGEEFLKVYLPNDIIPESIRAVNIQNMSITGDKPLFVRNITSELYKENIFQAANFVDGDGKQYYIDYVNNTPQEKPSSGIPDSMNCIDFLRDVAANNRCIILDINKDVIPYDIAMKLKSFIIDHAPIGVVIAEALKSGDIPPLIVNTPTSISCFGNESLPDRPFITDSFYLNNVPDILLELSNGDTLFFDSSVANFWAGATDGSVENTWYNTKAITQLNAALNLGDNGFTSADFSQGSFIYYSATGNQNSTSTVTLDVSATAKVGDKIVIMASVASRQQANRGFQITGISDQDIKLSYAGVFGDGFSHVNTNRVEYNPNNTENWSPGTENVNIFMAEGTLTSTQLVLSQPGTIKNGWQFIGYKTSREVI